ncbi:MAG: phosphate acyltransferase [Lawsonibacter sp.]|jgi:phosphate butyryltransferase
MVISGFQQLKNDLQQAAPKLAVVAAAHDPHTLQAVFAAQRDGLISPILVGRKDEIISISQSFGHPVSLDQVIHADSDAECARFAVDLIRQGKGQMLIKGMLPTGTLLKEVVHRETGIRSSQVMSHVAVLDVPSYPKLLFDTDGGMVIAPDLEQKRHILKNALDFCRFLGYDKPKAAILCAVETINPHMPETLDAAALKEEAARGDFGLCAVEGPISLDLATNPQAAEIKGFQGCVTGDADILLCPSIAAGNLLGKALYGLAGGQMAGVVLGASVPITVNSRGASPEEKYLSMLICSAMTAPSH